MYGSCVFLVLELIRFGGYPHNIARLCRTGGGAAALGAVEAGSATGWIAPTVVLGVSGFKARHRSSSSGSFAVGPNEHLLVRCANEPHLKQALFKCSKVLRKPTAASLRRSSERKRPWACGATASASICLANGTFLGFSAKPCFESARSSEGTLLSLSNPINS
jgi:hypothetical protein